MDEINLNDDLNTAVDEPIDFYEPQNKVPVTPDKVPFRAERYNYALGADSPGPDTLADMIQRGYDDAMRNFHLSREQRQQQYQKEASMQALAQQAGNEGRTLAPNDFEALDAITDPYQLSLIANPETFFEKKYADRVINDAIGSASQRALEMEEVSQYGLLGRDDVNVAKNFVATQGWSDKLMEDTEAWYNSLSFGQKAFDFVESALPFVSWYQSYNAIKTEEPLPWLQGDNLAAQAQLVRSMSPDEGYAVAKQAIADLKERNAYTALQFASAIQGMSSGEQYWDNFISVVDVATTGVPTATRLATGLAKAAGRKGATIPGILDRIGDQARSSWLETQSRLYKAAASSGARPNSLNDVTKELPSIFDIQKVFGDADKTPFSREQTDRMVDILTNQGNALVQKGILDPVNVTRIEYGSGAQRVLQQEAYKLFEQQYPNISDKVIDVEYIRSIENAVTNTDHIGINIGDTGAELFGDVETAINMAKYYGLNDDSYKVLARGDRYYLQITKAVDETSPTVRNQLEIDLKQDATPTTALSRFFGWARSADNLLPADINIERKNVVSASQGLSDLQSSIMQRASDRLGKWWFSKSRKDMRNFLEYQRDVEFPKVDSTGKQIGVDRGRFSNTVGEFVKDWQARYSRLPTEDETFAYFTYRQFNDIHYLNLNLNLTKMSQRAGLENFHFKRKGISPKVPPSIEGRIRSKLPEEIDDVGILVMPYDGATTYIRKNFANAAARNAVRDLVDKEGYKVFQITDWGEKTLREVPGLNLPKGRIRYVLSKDYESTPLPFKRVPYNPGGHVEYIDPYYVAQADITVSRNGNGNTIHDYYGDKNILNVRTADQAKKYAKEMDHARILRKEGKNDELRAYLKKSSLPYDYGKFTALFDKNRGGILDLDTPILARTRGTDLETEHKISKGYTNFRQSAGDVHNPINENPALAYALERNETLQSIQNLGSKSNPITNFRPARLLDPWNSMARAANSAVRGRYLEDLKIKSAERFAREFGDLLDDSSKDLRMYPMRALTEGKFNTSHPDVQRLADAKQFRRATLEFLATKPEENRWVDSIVNSLRVSLEKGLGEKVGEKVSDFVEPYLIATVKDPTKFLRQVAFHSKMGLFNPKQLFLQASGINASLALEGPKSTWKGVAAASLQRGLHMRGADNAIEKAAEYAEKFGWKKKHFIESYKALERTGFHLVGNEYGALDDFVNPTVVRGTFTKVLDVGLVPFREGERINRITAWNAAYSTWRDANPVAKLDDTVVKQIRARADNITGNMTRASNAGFNKGFASIPAQFMSYQFRLMDLMMGRQLSASDKRRIILTYSALYGVPSGVLGTTIGGFLPVNDMSRKAAMESGIDVTDVGWQTFLTGIPNMLLNEGGSIASGQPTQTDLSAFGPGGLTWLTDIFGQSLSEKTTFDSLTGPSGALAKSLWQAGYGLQEYVLSSWFASETDTDLGYPLEMSDFEPFLDNITTYSNAKKAFYMYSLGKYITRSGKVVDDNKTALDSMYKLILGTDPQSVKDYYIGLEIEDEREAEQNRLRPLIIKEMQKTYDSNISDEDLHAINKRIKVMLNMGDFSPEQRSSIRAKSIRQEHQTEIEKHEKRLRSRSMEETLKYHEKMRNGID